VEVAHEALLSRWARLRGWIETAREDVRTERRLAAAATEWEGEGRDPSFLLRGARLAHFEGWASTSDLAQGEAERGYLAASVDRRESRLAQEETLERRSRVRLRALVGVFAVLALVASGLTLLTAAQRERAQREALTATARGLAAASAANLDADPELSILLAMEAVRTYHRAGLPVGSDAVQALHDAVETSRVLLTFEGNAGGGAQLSPDGRLLATAGAPSAVGQGADVAIWDARTGRRLFAFPAHGDQIFDLEFSPDGSSLVTASADGTAKVWDATSGRELFDLTGHAGAVTDVVFSADGRRLATAGFDLTARLWDAASGTQLRVLRGHTGPVWGASFSAGGDRLATAAEDRTARIWDTRSGRELAVLHGHGEPVWDVTFSPDGTRLATVSNDLTARIWDAVTGRQLAVARGHRANVVELAFSPDGSRLATAGEDTARVWDAANGRQLLVLSGHAGAVLDVDFSPDGSRLATASLDGTARLWDATSGREVLAIPVPGGQAERLAFSPDGRVLAVADGDVVRLYLLPVDDLVRLARGRATRGLTSRECRQYLHREGCRT
jgi:WD40 repeat protein